MDELNDLIWLLDHGYVVAKRDPGLCNMVVDGLGKRVRDVDGAYMVFDPNNDADGFLLVGDKLPSVLDEARACLDVDKQPARSGLTMTPDIDDSFDRQVRRVNDAFVLLREVKSIIDLTDPEYAAEHDLRHLSGADVVECLSELEQRINAVLKETP